MTQPRREPVAPAPRRPRPPRGHTLNTINILGGSPSFRRGLQAALADNDTALRAIDDVKHAAADDLLIVVAPNSDDPTIAEAAAAHPLVVAFLPSPIAEDHVAAIRTGATAVIDSDADTEDIAEGLQDAARGHARIPISTLQRLVAIARSTRDRPVLAETEEQLLALLARGDSVRDIARANHWSERAIHRVLHNLYQRIGVANRDQAIVWSARNGILIEEPPA